MKEITILSGKGGTGKTSITAALGAVAENTVFCDNDVDAADLHLIFHPTINEKHTFTSGLKAIINTEKCTRCNICATYCRFNAIHTNENGNIFVDPFKCEGCRLCERVCPSSAIYTEKNNNNFWYVSSTRFGKMVHARMGPGEENSGKLVTQIRKKTKEVAQESNSAFIINDGPPGIGCAAIASLSGTNQVLIVTEPTKSGLHDLRRLVELIRSFEVPAYAVINKCDINKNVADQIEEYLESENIKVLARFPFDKRIVKAMAEGKTIIEYDMNSEFSKKIIEVWKMLNK